MVADPGTAGVLQQWTSVLYEDAAFFAAMLTPAGDVVHVNDTALEFVETSLDDVQGEPFWQTPWWNHSTALQAELRGHVEASSAGRQRRFEATHRSAAGETVVMAVHLRPIVLPADHPLVGSLPASARPVGSDDERLVGHIATGRDVTEQKRVEAELRESRQRVEGLYELSTDRHLDLEAKVDRALTLGRRRLGLAEGFLSRVSDGVLRIEAAQGEHEKLQPGNEAPLEETYCQHTISLDEDTAFAVSDAASSTVLECDVVERFGLQCYLGATVEVDDTVYGTICFADTTVTDREFTDGERTFVELLAQWLGYELERNRHRQRLERQNTRLEEFANVAAHDLRSPLNTATGHVALALDAARSDDHDADELVAHLEKVAAAHERMDGLISDVLQLATEGQTVGQVDARRLDRLVTAAAAMVDARMDVDVDVDDVAIYCDTERTQTLLENLLRNAVEHGATDGEGRHTTTSPDEHEGGVGVRVGTLAPDAVDGTSGFYVADDGPGIPDAERDRVFEQGYTTHRAGTGFGLSIVRSIADAHDWTVTVTESAAGGARFEFTGVRVEHEGGDD